MNPCIKILIPVFLFGLAAGQEPSDDSFQIESLPIWEVDETGFSMSAPDTLDLTPKKSAHPNPNRNKLVGLGLMIISGTLNAYFHSRAEASFNDYESSGNLNEMETLFYNAEQFDRLSGLSYLGVEIGFFLFAYSYLDK